MGEIITLHIGQAGVGIGEAFWEELIREHNLTLSPGGGLFHQDGPSSDPKTAGSGSQLAGHSYLNSFFHENRDGNFVPRSLFVDLDGSSLDAVKKGSLKGVFSQVTGFVGGKEDDSDNYVRAHYTIGKETVDPVLNNIRRMAESTDILSAFMLTHSVCGGTGSGFTALLQERLSVDYGKKIKFNATLVPCAHPSVNVLSDYNSILAIHSLLEHSDLTVMLQNDSIYNILKYNLDIEEPSFKNANKVIARYLVDLTSGMRRVNKSGRQSLQDMGSSLLPYPRIHFLTGSQSPWVSKDR